MTAKVSSKQFLIHILSSAKMTPSIPVQRNTRSSSDLCIPQLRVRSRSWVLLAVVFTMVFVCGEILAQTSDAPIDDSTVSTPNVRSNRSLPPPLGNTAAGVRYVTTAFNWSVTPNESYVADKPAAVRLNPCPMGVSGKDKDLYVLISGGKGATEVVSVTGGTCTPGSTSGTLVFIPKGDHSGPFKVGSSSTGIYEALRDVTAENANNAKIVLSPSNPPETNYYSIYAPITVSGAFIDIDCSEAMLDIETSRAAFVLTSSSAADRIHNCRVGTKTGSYGAPRASAGITQISCSTNVATISTTLNPPVGSVVDIQGTFSTHFWGTHVVKGSNASSWTYDDPNCGGVRSIAAQFTAGGVAYENAFIEDDGQGNHFDHIAVNFAVGFEHYALNNLIVVLNDQAAHISDVQLITGLSGCSSIFCANGIYAPGPFRIHAAVIYADHLNFSLSCTGNGITDYSGNTLSVSDSVIQGFSQWAITDGVLKGGYGPSTLTNVYNEVGNCTNPLYPGSGPAKQAETGLLAFGQSNTVRGGEGPNGSMPKFAAQGDQRAQYNYYLVVHDSELGISAPLWCGYALVDSANPRGSITVACPRVTGTNTISYDLLRTTRSGNHRVYPFAGECRGGSTQECGAVLVDQVQCQTIICTFTDDASTKTTSYALKNYPTYFPKLNFWPGGIVLDTPSDTKNPLYAATQIYGDDTTIAGGDAIIALQSQMSSGMFKNCSTAIVGVQLTCLEGNSSGANNPQVVATLLQNGGTAGGGVNGIKGRLNFLNPPGYLGNAGEVITVFDCHPEKTLATSFYRPAADPCDNYFGIDHVADIFSVGTAYGASNSQSWYINNLPDDKTWSARLTAAKFMLQVPVGTTAVKFKDLPLCGSVSEGLHRAITDSQVNTWGAVIAGKGTNHVEAYCDGTNWTVSAK